MSVRQGEALARHTGVYAAGIVLSKLIGFLMIPVYTRMLTPADYGVLELLSMTTDVIAMLVGLGLAGAVMRFYYDPPPGDEPDVVVSTAYLISGSLILGVTLLTLPLAGALSGMVFGTAVFAPLVRLALVNFAVTAGLEIPFVHLRAQQRSGRVVSLNLVRLVLQLSLNILFVVMLRRGVEGVLLANLIASVCLGGYLVVSTVRTVGVHFSRASAEALVRYGAPLVLVNAASFIISFSDRWFLRSYGTLADVGLYGLAYRFAILIAVFIAAPFGQIWAAKSLEVWKQPGARQFFGDAFRYFNAVTVLAALALALFSADAIRVVSSAAYAPAGRIVPLLVLAYVFFSYRQFSYVGISIAKRSGYAALSSWIAVAAVLVLNVLLIPRWGAWGAAAATLGAYALEFAVTLAFSQRLIPLDYPFGRVFTTLGAAILVAILALAATASMPLLTGLAVKAAMLLAFGVGVLPWTSLTRRERRAVLRFSAHPVAQWQALRAAA